MIINQKEKIDPHLRKQLQDYVYDTIGVIQNVYKELPNGMPEYIYQEALDIAFEHAGLHPQKDFIEYFELTK